MARTGRPAKPTALKILEGDTKAKAKRGEPKPALVAPDPPAWFDERARTEWDRIVPALERLGLLSEVDGAALEAYCAAYSLMVLSAEDVHRRGPLIPGARSGDLVRNPSVQSMRDAASTMRAYATEFGLTPQARARMALPGEEDDNNEIELLFSRVK